MQIAWAFTKHGPRHTRLNSDISKCRALASNVSNDFKPCADIYSGDCTLTILPVCI